MDPKERLAKMARMHDGYGSGAAKVGHAPSSYAIWMGSMRKKGYTMAEAAKHWDKKLHAPKTSAPVKYKSQRKCEEACAVAASKVRAKKKQ